MPIGRTLLPIASGGSPPSTSGIYPFQGAITGMNDIITFAEIFNNAKLPYIGEQATTYMIATGFRHVLAIKNFVSGTGGELWVWGFNSSGSIGGSTNYQWTRIGVDSDWTWVSAAGNSSYAIRAGRLYVTGENSNGELGNGTTTDVSVFTQVGSDTDWEKVSGGSLFGVAIKNGDLLTTGFNNSFRTGLNTSVGVTNTWTVANNTETWEWISGGIIHGAAITDDGRMFTWGTNLNGRTARNTAVGTTNIPTQEFLGDTDWVQVECSNASTIARKTSGTVWGCGVGAGSVWGSVAQVTVFNQEALGDTDWVWIANQGANAQFALKSDGTIWTSGFNIANLQQSTVNTFAQFGSETDWKTNFFGNKNGFSQQMALLK
jgi:alpha-tubulin suppressor-like RCC1 family protein